MQSVGQPRSKKTEQQAARRAAARGPHPKPRGVAPRDATGQPCKWDTANGGWLTSAGRPHVVEDHPHRWAERAAKAQAKQLARQRREEAAERRRLENEQQAAQQRRRAQWRWRTPEAEAEAAVRTAAEAAAFEPPPPPPPPVPSLAWLASVALFPHTSLAKGVEYVGQFGETRESDDAPPAGDVM